MEMRRFELKKEQIEFLKEMYPDNELVQRVLNCENNGVFEVDVDTKIWILWSTWKMSRYIG